MREIKIDQSYTKRDEDSLNRYLTDISKIPMISAEEEVQLARRIKQGDQPAVQRLVRANLRFVISVAKKYQGQGLPLSDLVNEGNIGLITAARKFDETKGFKFISYAVWWIRQGIMNAMSEHTRMVRVPMNQILAVQKIRKQQTELEQRLEREPTLSELAEAAEIGEMAVAEHLDRHKTTKSLDEKIAEDTELDLAGILSDPNMVAADEQMNCESVKEDIRRLLGVLKKREQKIIIELFGLGGTPELSLEDVARRNDLSRERVRQLKSSSIEKLKYHASLRLTEHFQN